MTYGTCYWKMQITSGKQQAGYAVVFQHQIIEASPHFLGTLAQLVELIAQVPALELAKGKRASLYTDCKYAFLVLHAHAEDISLPKILPLSTESKVCGC